MEKTFKKNPYICLKHSDFSNQCEMKLEVESVKKKKKIQK